MCLVLTRIPCEISPRRLRSLLMCSGDISRALINSLVWWWLKSAAVLSSPLHCAVQPLIIPLIWFCAVIVLTLYQQLIAYSVHTKSLQRTNRKDWVLSRSCEDLPLTTNGRFFLTELELGQPCSSANSHCIPPTTKCDANTGKCSMYLFSLIAWFVKNCAC